MADDLDISVRTMHYLVSIGCPCIQIRKLLWFDREEVIAWLNQFQRIKRDRRKRALKAKKAKEAVS
jgi:hypothetical protein